VILKRAVEARAREDARLGIYQPDEYIVASQGLEPGFDPVENLEHASIGNRLQNPIIEELRRDLEREEDEGGQHQGYRGLAAMLGLVLCIEVAGAIHVMRTLGIESPERVIFGVALALVLFVAAWFAAQTEHRVRAIAAFVSLAVLVVALAVIRVDDNSTEGGTQAIDWATAVIMVGVTVGPALMAEYFLRKLAVVLPISRRVSRLKRRLRRAVRSTGRATDFVTSTSRQRRRWQQEAARRRALYNIAYHAAEAELGAPRPAEQARPLALPTTNHSTTVRRPS
jgi:hypothetical protein